MTLSDEQIETFSQEATMEFANRVLVHLGEVFPQQVGSFTEWELLMRVREAIQRAREYGLTSEQGVCLYTDLSFVFGDGFDQRLSWAGRVLRDERIQTESERFDRLRVEAALHEDEVITQPTSLSSVGESITATFAPTPVINCEQKLRSEIVEGMRLACRRPGGIEYGESLDTRFWIPRKVWNKKKAQWIPLRLTWVLQPGASPSAAIDRVFDLNAGSKMECLSVMSAIYYRAIRKICGSKRFDTMFANGTGIEISQRSPVFRRPYLKKHVLQNMESGDWVYFLGHIHYDSYDMNEVLGKG
jgi:Protein-glutamine gamma-glutamyltransferase